MSSVKTLFEDFPSVTTKEWMDRIHADLKGDDFNEKLVWKTREGFKVMPFYRQDDISDLPFITSIPGEAHWIRGTSDNGNNWMVRQDIIVEDYSNANKKARDILAKGVDSLGFIIRHPESVNKESLEILLCGILIEGIEINFVSEGKAKEILSCFYDILHKNKTDIINLRGAIEADPLGRLMLRGKLCVPVKEGLDYLTELTVESLSLSKFRTIHVNGPWISDPGGDIVTELAFVLAMGNEYMSVLTDRGVTADQAASKIKFSFGTGSNYFFEIAKLRAARLLWTLITEGYKLSDRQNAKMEIHCITGSWNKTEKEPYVNILRTQTEAMSAVIGGANSITVRPFNFTFSDPDELSERIARNQQLLLKHEAYFSKVIDPAGGSWYVEMLTSIIADEAWKLFIEVENQGGFTAALNKGFVDDRIRKNGVIRMAEIAMQKDLYGLKGND